MYQEKMNQEFVVHGPVPLKPLPQQTLGELIYNSLKNNTKQHDALVDVLTGEKKTYRDLLEETCILAECMQNYGLRNDIVSICSENSVHFYQPMIAALYTGNIVATINPNYSRGELQHVLNLSKPKIIFCSKSYLLKFTERKKEANFIERIVVIDSSDKHQDADNLQEFINAYYRKNAFQPFHFDNEQAALILCSSGTTGLPKGVMITHKNVITKFMHETDPRVTRQCDSKVVLGFLPFFHGFGLNMYLCAIYCGNKVVVLSRFEEELFLKTIETYRISLLYLVPALLLFLAKSPLVDRYDLSSVVHILFGSAPCSTATIDLVQKRLKNVEISQGYGLTESTVGIIITPPGQQRVGSVGKVLPYISTKIRDLDTGKSVGPNEVGELCVKGSMVMEGYYKNEEATKNSFDEDGWLLTGDLAYYDQDEYFYIIDRLKELIKYKGFQVPPAELEAILVKHPKIRDAGVIGVPNDEVGELPLAFVVKVPGESLTEKEIVDYVASEVSAIKRLRGGVIFTSSIPKNASGKIIRKELKDMLKQTKAKL